MSLKFDRIDYAGIGEILKSGPMAAAVHSIAASIAGNIEGDVVVDDYVTDRAASSVTLREANALLRQARDGVMTRAASGAGVEVKGK